MNSKKAAIGFIFVTMLLDIIGLGIIIPVMPKLIAALKHISINEASKYGGSLLMAFALTQFIFSPIVGNLSDRFGRRPILLVSMLGFSVNYLILAFAPTYSWFFLGRVVAGVTGASITTASAYIADISTNENRQKNFGMIGAAFGLGFVIGPWLGGVLGSINMHFPFYAAAILCFVNFIYGYFVLPESLSKRNRRRFSWKKSNPFSSLKYLFQIKPIRYLVFAYFFLYVGGHAVQSNWPYYTMYKLKWSEFMVGNSLAVVGILVGLVQALLIRKTSVILGNEKSVYLGFASYSLGMLLFALATQGWMMFVFLIPYCLGGISVPSLQSIISTQVPANEQGQLQGGLTSIMSLSNIVGPQLMTGMFSYFTTNSSVQLPGISFFLGALLMGSSAIITYYSLHIKKHVSQAVS
ncbi:MAG TPA: TCR/Tet family MFS transporter [Chitinophagaceae bacterium]|nr:TCR/Tet family MFS transporter [Chitinophagaceae bacterium]